MSTRAGNVSTGRNTLGTNFRRIKARTVSRSCERVSASEATTERQTSSATCSSRRLRFKDLMSEFPGERGVCKRGVGAERIAENTSRMALTMEAS